MNRVMASLGVIFIGIFFAQPAKALSLIDRDIDELFGESSLVANVKIIGVSGDCTPGGCDATYKAAIISTEKGTIDKVETGVCSYVDLSLGGSYLIFMNKNDRDHDGCEYDAWHDDVFWGVAGVFIGAALRERPCCWKIMVTCIFQMLSWSKGLMRQ